MARTVPLASLMKEHPGLFPAHYRLYNDIIPTGRGAVQTVLCMKETTVNDDKNGGYMNEVSYPSGIQSIPPEVTENGELPRNMRIKILFNHGESSKSVVGAPKKEKRKFSVALSSKQIEEDVLAMTGKKPLRRPKKRPRQAQKNINAVFPGLCITL